MGTCRPVSRCSILSALVALVATFGLLVGPAWPQQSKKIPVIGVLATHAAVTDPIFDSLRAGLRERGYEDGRNIKVDIVTADGQLDRLSGLAEDLVRANVDVILCANEICTRAARKATATIPILSIGFGGDPVAAGLVESLSRPGGNITGTYSLFVELNSKRLEILKEALPGVGRLAVFWDPAFGQSALDEVQRAARVQGVRLEVIEVRSAQDLETVFKTARRKNVGAGLLLVSTIFYINRAQVAMLALDARLPTMSWYDQMVEAGSLMSYGSDVRDDFRHAAYYVERLLKGAKPGDLPVEQVSKIKLAVNLKTAKALGITIPESILLRADEVIR